MARYTIVDHHRTKRCEFLTRFLTFDTYSCSRMARTRRRAIWMGWDSALTIQGTTALRYSSVSYRFQYIFVYLFSGEIYRVKTFLPCENVYIRSWKNSLNMYRAIYLNRRFCEMILNTDYFTWNLFNKLQELFILPRR